MFGQLNFWERFDCSWIITCIPGIGKWVLEACARHKVNCWRAELEQEAETGTKEPKPEI